MSPELNPRAQDLLQRAVDGRTSPAEHQELEGLLRGSAQARQELGEIRELVDELEHAAQPAVPDLFPALRHRLQQAGTRPAKSRPRAPRWLLASSWGLVAAGLLAVVVFHHPDPAPGFASGAMGSLAARSWQVVAQAETPAAAITVRRNGSACFVEARIHASGPGTLTLRWDPARFSLLNLQPAQPPAPVQAGPGELKVQSPVTGSLGVILARRDGPGGDPIVVAQDGAERVKVTIPEK